MKYENQVMHIFEGIARGTEEKGDPPDIRALQNPGAVQGENYLD